MQSSWHSIASWLTNLSLSDVPKYDANILLKVLHVYSFIYWYTIIESHGSLPISQTKEISGMYWPVADIRTFALKDCPSVRLFWHSTNLFMYLEFKNLSPWFNWLAMLKSWVLPCQRSNHFRNLPWAIKYSDINPNV